MKNITKCVSPSQRGKKGEIKKRIKPTYTKQEIHSRGLICNGNHLPYNPNNRKKAKILRKRMTATETLLWKWIKKQAFRTLRQHPIDHYIVDFYIACAGLVIEIDGSSHFTPEGKRYDKQRTNTLELYHLKVIRYTNTQVRTAFESVCEDIVWNVNERKKKSHPSPLSKKGGNGKIVTIGRYK